MNSRFLYYAFGGGMGHAIRTISLARQLSRLGGTHVVVSNSPFAGSIQQVARREPGIVLVVVCSSLNAGQCQSRLRELHDAIDPEVLIVDTFPRGLGGELVPLLQDNEHPCRVLVSRALPHRYVTDFQLPEFVAEHYDLVIAPGEPFGVGSKQKDSVRTKTPQFQAVEPFLIRDAVELPSRALAADRLSADPDRPVVLFVGSGNHDECGEMANLFDEVNSNINEVASAAQCRLAMPVSPANRAGKTSNCITHSPLIELFPAVDFVVGSAGYNLYWETRVLEIPGYLRARRRKYDCQAQRNSDAHDTFSAQELVERIQRVNVRDTKVPAFINGACQAAKLVKNATTHPSVSRF